MVLQRQNARSSAHFSIHNLADVNVIRFQQCAVRILEDCAEGWGALGWVKTPLHPLSDQNRHICGTIKQTFLTILQAIIAAYSH